MELTPVASLYSLFFTFGQVDEKLYYSLLTSNALEAMKLALVSSTSTLICRALEDLKHKVVG